MQLGGRQRLNLNIGRMQGRPLPSAYAATDEEDEVGGGSALAGSSLLRGSMETSALLEEGREASAPR